MEYGHVVLDPGQAGITDALLEKMREGAEPKEKVDQTMLFIKTFLLQSRAPLLNAKGGKKFIGVSCIFF